MKFRIHDGISDDYFDLEGSSIEGIKEQAEIESKKRGYNFPWSEEK